MKTVLVVDDSEMILNAARELLTHSGYRVITADTPFELDQIIRTHKPDLMLIDVDMPMLSGEKLVDAARRHQLDECPVVFFSGLDEEELQKLVFVHGVAGYIHKKALKDLPAKVAGFLKR